MTQTQEERESLLFELEILLPYNVAVYIDTGTSKYNSTIVGIDKSGFVIVSDGSKWPIENVKPYFFPISTISNKQIRKLVRSKWPYSKCRIHRDLNIRKFEVIFTDHSMDMCYCINELPLLGYNIIEELRKNHFDTAGFLNNGLAIDATGLKIY